MHRFSDKRILIIDNEDDIVGADRQALQEAGYGNIRHTDNGAAGLEIAREWKPDLIISDIVHPGPDGFRIFEELCLAHPDHAPLFIVTSNGLHGIYAAAFQKLETSGMAVYLQKPFKGRELVRLVDGIFLRAENGAAK